MPKETEAHRRISTYYLEYASKQDKEFLRGSQKLALDNFSQEWKNIEARLVWSRQTPDHHPAKTFLGALMSNAPYCLDYFLSTMERRMYLEQALRIARHKEDRLAEAKYLGDIGLTYDQVGDYTTAANYHRQRIFLARQMKDVNAECVALNNLGDSYNSLSDNMGFLPMSILLSSPQKELVFFPFHSVKALWCFQRASMLSQKYGLTVEKARALHWAGLAYIKMNFFESARNHLHRAWEVGRNTTVEVDKARMLMGLAFYHMKLGDSGVKKRKNYLASLEYYKKAYESSKRSGNPQDEMMCMTSLGWAYVRVHQETAAIDSFKEGLAKSRKFNLKADERDFLVALGTRYEITNEDLAIEMLKEAFRVSEELGHFSGAILKSIALIYWRARRLQEAFFYFEKADLAYQQRFEIPNLLLLFYKYICRHPWVDWLFYVSTRALHMTGGMDFLNRILFWFLSLAERRYYAGARFRYSSSILVDLKDMIQQYSTKIELEPRKWSWYLARGSAFAAIGEDQKALEDIKTAIARNSKRIEAYSLLETLDIYSCAHSEMLEILDQGIKLLKKNADLYYYRGQIYYSLGQYDLASQDFMKAIQKGIKRPCTFSHLGLALFRCGRRENSQQWFAKARSKMRNTPDSYLISYDFAIKSLLEGDVTESLLWLRIACEANSHATVDRIYRDIKDTALFTVIQDDQEFRDLLGKFIA